jgi:GNAT superfamily N-acetyltransferase
MKAMKEGYHIRVMNLEEVEDIAIEWAAREGWNPGLNDAECFYAADPDSFLVGELDGKVIACISAVNYQNEFGFVGFYIVHPDYRGLAYGYELAKVALDRLQGINIGVDGVIDQVENYKRYGFSLAYRNVRYEGVSEAFAPHPNVHAITESDMTAILAFDRNFFPAQREAFLVKWIHQKGGCALVFKEGVEIKGYGVMRPCFQGYKIGPLFAENAEIAEQLLNGLSGSLPEGSTFYLDIPEPNAEANMLVKRYQMKKVFETARMYNRAAPELPLDRIFGITSFELG